MALRKTDNQKPIKTTKPTIKKDITRKERKELFLVALEQSLGVVSQACKKIKMDRSTYYEWMDKDKVFEARVKEIENATIDFAETQLHKRIKEGSDTAIIFFLKTKGRNRGYVERIETVNKQVTDFDKTEEQILEELEQLKSKIK